MDFSWFELSHQAIEIMESQEKLHNFEVSAYPHLEKANRQKIHKETYQRGWPNSFVKKSVVTLSDVAKVIGASNG
jgi:hypothetical protein